MLICDQEFAFSTLNADDIDRMDAAQKHLETASAAEAERAKTTNAGYADALRGQCRLIIAYLDEVLGEGAAAKLGLTGSDLGACTAVVESFRQSIEAEKAAMPGLNRAQRRVLAKQPDATDKATRRRQLIAALAELDHD